MYIILVLPAMFFAMWASFKVKRTFNLYSSQSTTNNLSAHEVCRTMLDNKGLYAVAINRISGNLTDHFDPRTNTINLSDSVYNSTSTAAIGVACHEAGHAIQYAEQYNPIMIRNAIFPVVNFSSNLAIPLIFIGFFFLRASNMAIYLVYLGIILFASSTLFHAITLPVEFDASNRAISALRDSQLLSTFELKGAKKVLDAAALTYVAALAVSLAQLLRLVALTSGRSSRSRD